MVRETTIGHLNARFALVGGALFRRAAHLLADEVAAARVAEQLFVRFVVYARVERDDARTPWAWIYRVATNHCLRQLPDDVPPGRRTFEPGRRVDEATRLMVVLSELDGLTPDEIGDVVGLPIGVVRRRIASTQGKRQRHLQGEGRSLSPARIGDQHPSIFALDRDREVHAEHLAGCARCRQIADEADRLVARFTNELAPVASARVAAAIKTEYARLASGPGWKRAVWMGGALVLAASLALLVARPRSPDRGEVPYFGLKGASRATAAGIQITVDRGLELRALEPGVVLRPGDRLHFRVRSERPRFLELRVRDIGGDTRVFPGSGSGAQQVSPGQVLDRDYIVGAGAGAMGDVDEVGGVGGVGGVDKMGKVGQVGQVGREKWPSDSVWIVGLFAVNTFVLDRDPGPDTEVVPVRADIRW